MVLAAGDDQNKITLWKLTNTKPRIILEGHQTNPCSMLFNQDATKLFTGTVGGTAHVWDMT
jgi:WD40 repeat protein